MERYQQAAYDYDYDNYEYYENSYATSFNALEELSDWELVNEDQDIRGRDLVAPGGAVIGRIDEMMVNRAAERVAAVKLDNGRVYDVDHLEIEDDRVIFNAARAPEALAAAGVKSEAYTAETDVASARTTQADGEVTVPIVEEEAVIGKRRVLGDSIAVRTGVATETVSKQVDLQKQDVDVTIRERNETLTEAEADNLLQSKEIVAEGYEEQAVVGKTAKVTGEVVVDTDEHIETETVTETVRKTDVDIIEDADADIKRRK